MDVDMKVEIGTFSSLVSGDIIVRPASITQMAKGVINNYARLVGGGFEIGGVWNILENLGEPHFWSFTQKPGLLYLKYVCLCYDMTAQWEDDIFLCIQGWAAKIVHMVDGGGGGEKIFPRGGGGGGGARKYLLSRNISTCLYWELKEISKQSKSSMYNIRLATKSQ